MPKTFVVDDPTIDTGNMVAHLLHSTLRRGCKYIPDSPCTKGEGDLADDETGHSQPNA